MISKIIFWAQGGESIGLGHLKRCLAIAKYFRKKNFSKIIFYINRNNNICKILKEENFSYSFNSEIEKSEFDDKTLFVFDTKNDVSKQVLFIKQKGSKVCLIDNLTKAKDYSDIVILPGAHFIHNYNKNYLSGGEYFPIDERFFKYRNRKNFSNKFTILVSFGGTDPNNLTIKTIKLLKDYHEKNIKFKILIGPCFRYKEKIRSLIKKADNRFNFFENINIEKIINNCNVAITAFGISIYEFAYLGIPSIIIANYREDKKWAENLNKIGMSIFLGYHKDVIAYRTYNAIDFLQNKEIFKNMSYKCKKIIDGKGTERIFKAILSLTQVIP